MAFIQIIVDVRNRLTVFGTLARNTTALHLSIRTGKYNMELEMYRCT